MKNKNIHVLFGVVSVLFLVTVVFGILFAGSPQQARNDRFDRERERDLQEITYQIEDYYSEYNKVPTSLDELPRSSYYHGHSSDILDPETGEQYGYTVLSEKSYSLCAVFLTDSSDDMVSRHSISSAKHNWDHSAGEHCFERTVRTFEEKEPVFTEELQS